MAVTCIGLGVWFCQESHNPDGSHNAGGQAMTALLVMTGVASLIGVHLGDGNWRSRHARRRFDAEFLFRLGSISRWLHA